jgi:hypothetical protein
MKAISQIAGQVEGSATLADLFDAGFAAFETIRLAARACQDQAPELFAAFLTAAGTAVEDRNALYDAPSFPLNGSGPWPAPGVSTTADTAGIADQLAALATLVARRLQAAQATRPATERPATSAPKPPSRSGGCSPAIPANTMRPVLGDLLAQASRHLETATADGAKLSAEGAGAVVWELSRVTAAMTPGLLTWQPISVHAMPVTC